MALQGRLSSFDPRWVTLGVTTIGSFMSLLNQTMVNIGLPKIIATFGVDVQVGQWVVTAYMISLSVVIPISGYLAERVGMKRLYLTTMLAFVVSSALCGIAWDLPSLVFFRILQGLGGGMLQPLGMAIVFSIITPRERPKFMALLGMPMLVAPLLGPTLGGFLVEYVDWHTVFTVNIPVGMVGLVLAWFLLKETPARHDAPLDRMGFMLSTIAFPSLLLGFTFGSREGWGTPAVQVYLAVGIMSFAGWIYTELNQAEPMLDLRLFKAPVFAAAMGMNFLAQILLFGMQLLLPIYLQAAQGMSALQAGLVLVPQGIVSFISMNIASQLYYRVGPRPLVIFGLGVLTLTSWQMSHVTLGTSAADITLLAAARGFAMGFMMMPVQTAAYSTVPQPQIARATALSNGLMRIYGSFSTAFLATILNDRAVFHYAAMASTLTPDRPAVAGFLDQLQPELIARGLLTEAAQQRFIGSLLAAETHRQALGMAFTDTLMVMTAFGVAGFALIFFINDPLYREGRQRGPRPVAASAAPASAMAGSRSGAPLPAGGPAPSHAEP